MEKKKGGKKIYLEFKCLIKYAKRVLLLMFIIIIINRNEDVSIIICDTIF